MTVLRSGVSSYILSSKPSTEFKSPARIRIQTGTPSARAMFQFNLPADLRKGATVHTAKLRLQTGGGGWPGPVTLTAQRIAAPWKVSKLNWNNRPGVSGSPIVVSQTDVVANGLWEFDVVADVQAWVDGTAKNYGHRIITDQTATRHFWGFTAAKYRPTLEVTYSFAPAAPTTLHPSAGAVSMAKPVLRWDAGDIAALEVQVDPAANATTPAFDSGWVISTANEFDLSTSAYAGLANNASTQWRARVQDSTGAASPWSQWMTFSRVDKAPLVVTQPGPIVTEASPPIAFTMAGMVAFRVTIAQAASPTRLIYDSNKIAGTIGERTPPSVIVRDGSDYVVTVQAWDGVDREATTGDPVYVETSVTTTLQYSATVTEVDWVSADQAFPAPWVDVKWSRSVQPDGWAIVRDGETIYVEDVANDLIVSGNVYVWRDWTATPHRQHLYRVAPVVNGVTSSEGPEAVITPVSGGIWLADPDTERDVVLWGEDAGTWAHGGDATVYDPIGGTSAVRVTTSLRGLEGTLAGVLVDAQVAEDYPVDVTEPILWDFKSDPNIELRLVAGDINIPVSIFDLSLFPDPLTTEGRRVVNVTFGFSQTGELPFSADL